MSQFEIRALNGRPASKAFARVARTVYRADLNWVPPFPGEEARIFNPLINPSLHRIRSRRWVAFDRAGPAGRIAAFAPADRPGVGYFGFFESPPDSDCAARLLRSAETWLAEVGCDRCYGPVPVAPRDQLGLLIEGFDRPPCLFTPYNPPYYRGLVESAGYEAECFLRAYAWQGGAAIPEPILKLSTRQRSSRFRIREIDPTRLEEETQLIARLVNETLADAWHYYPITAAEARELAVMLRPIVDRRIALVADDDHGPCGVALALPDANWLWRKAGGRLLPLGWAKLWLGRRTIPQARAMALGLADRARRTGLAALLLDRWFRAAIERGYRAAELSQIFDDNWPMRRILDRLGLPIVRRYAVFGRRL